MRRLNEVVRDERGATAVMVGLLMVPLIGVAAIGVDAGSLYWEDAQLQNGADAAAGAVASHCANPIDSAWTPDQIASQLSASNANGTAPSSTTVTFDASGCAVSGGRVTVKTVRSNASHPLASAIGIGATDVRTQATAVWGYPSGVFTLPIAISYCSFLQSGFDPAVGTASGIQLLQLNNSTSQGAKSVSCAGSTYPGGFGWLSNDICAMSVSLGWVSAVPGKSFPSPCDLSTLKGQTVLVPIYNDQQGTGSNGQFKIYGFAALTITGWRFTGPNDSPDLSPGAPACTQQCNGIWGKFVKFTFTDTDTTQYGGPNLGGKTVQLVKDWS